MIIGGLFVLALTAALVGPHFVDWTSYRADFEREATAVLGRRVTVEGDVTARILPFPSLSFSKVVVAGNHPDEPAMTVETFSMDAELAPFMRGEVLIFDMRLDRPRVTIDMGADGTVDWAIRPSTPFDPGQIALERLTVTEGEVTLIHASAGRIHKVEAIEAEISARALTGPWRADGTATVDGTPTVLGISTGKVDENGAMRLRIRAEPSAKALVLEADGETRLERGALRFAGGFNLGLGKPQNLAAAEDAEAADGATPKAAVPEGPRPYRLNGRFALDHERLTVEEFRFETGPVTDPYTADGSALVDLGGEPRFEIEAKGAQVRIDDAKAVGQGAGLALAGRLAAVEAALAALPRPSIPGSVEVALPAVVAGDTTIRDVRVSADTAVDGWAVKTFAATLPGRTTLEGSGQLRTAGGLAFDGDLLLAVAQPSGFAAWLSSDVDEAVRRLPGAGFKAQVALTPERQRFSALELILGSAKFQGEIDRRQPPDAKPSMLVKLAGGALDVEGARAFASLFVSDAGVNRLADHDLDLDVKAGPVSAAGLTAETVDTALRLREGTLEIDRLSVGGVEGATVSATGTLSGFPAAPSGRIDASVIAVDLAQLMRVLAERFPDNPLIREVAARAAAHPGLFADTALDLVGSAEPAGDGKSALRITAKGKTGGSDVTLSVSGTGARNALGEAPLEVSLSAKNPDAEMLLGLYGLPVLPLGQLPGGQATFEAKGTLAGGLDAGLTLEAGDFVARWNGRATAWGDRLTAAGPVSIEAADIEPWLMATGIGLPGMGFGLPLALAADLDYRDGVLSLAGLKGTVEEGAVGGDLELALKDGVPDLTGRLALDTLELSPLAALVLGDGALDSADGGWPQGAFRQGVSTPFTADLDVTAASLSAGAVAAANDVRMKARLNGEGLRLADLQGKLFGGTLSGLFELRNTGGTGLFSTQLKLESIDLETALPDAGLAGRSNLTASLSATGKSLEAMVAGLSGSGTATLSGLTVSGLNAGALPALIAAADKVGRDIDAARTAVFAPPILVAGNFVPKDAEFAFSVAGGVLRAPPLTLEAGGARLTTELRANAATGRVNVDGTIAFDPGEDKVAGSEPVVRFSLEGTPSAAVRRLDTEPLAQFLTQRALEIEQARVEAMQAALLERQRLRREVRYYAALQTERDSLAEELRRADDALKRKAVEEERRRAEEIARAKAAEETARAKAAEEEAARARAAAAEEVARTKAADQAARRKEAEDAAARARVAAEEAARAKAAEEEAARARAAAEEAVRQSNTGKEAVRQQGAGDEAARAKAADEEAARARAAAEEAVRQSNTGKEAVRQQDAGGRSGPRSGGGGRGGSRQGGS